MRSVMQDPSHVYLNFVNQFGWLIFQYDVGSMFSWKPMWVVNDHNDNIIVTDHANHRVWILTNTGAVVRYWGLRGSGDAMFDHPSGVGCDWDHVYIVDTENNRIKKYTLDGTYVKQWKNETRGYFNNPTGMAVL